MRKSFLGALRLGSGARATTVLIGALATIGLTSASADARSNKAIRARVADASGDPGRVQVELRQLLHIPDLYRTQARADRAGYGRFHVVRRMDNLRAG